MLDSRGSKGDFPHGYQVQVSTDGKTWSKPLAEGTGRPILTIGLPFPSVKILRITQTGRRQNFWSIHELLVKGEEL